MVESVFNWSVHEVLHVLKTLFEEGHKEREKRVSYHHNRVYLRHCDVEPQTYFLALKHVKDVLHFLTGLLQLPFFC